MKFHRTKRIRYNLYKNVQQERKQRRIKLATALASLTVLVGILATNMIISYARSTPQTKISPSSGPAVSVVKSAKSPAKAVVAAITPTPKPAPSQTALTGGVNFINLVPLWAKLPFFVDPANEAATYFQSNQTVDGAAQIQKVGQTPVADWFGDWTPDVSAAANSYVTAATQSGAMPVLVLYNIPERDCGSYSAGGAASVTAYTQWVQQAANGIGNRLALVLLEPDALAGLDCLSSADQASRYSALAQAIVILKGNANTAVYVDAGNPGWQTVGTMASRLRAANITAADGFSLNVSNYISTAKNQSYGDQLSKLVDNRHYVIDTSRNGNGNLSPSDWCNNAAAALGAVPTANTGDPLNDALLWVKRPWESDGSCNGAPDAGSNNWPFLVQIARNAGW
jgi:endoglucanase